MTAQQRTLAHLEPEAKAKVDLPPRVEVKVRQARMEMLVPEMVPVTGCVFGCTPEQTVSNCGLHTGYVNLAALRA